ncbi:MAG: hypothetical protein HOP29_10400 [Phycisphaerales bacterium]|nr:hypothetical protein [Phycisphaerales bacterium]
MSDRRFDDAVALCKSGKNSRANGAMYLGGIALELLLKALLLEKHPWLQRPLFRRDKSRRESALIDLCYKYHDLESLLGELPELRARLLDTAPTRWQREPLLQSIQRACSEWTIHIRYSTRQARIDDAESFLDRVKELRPWLR